MRKAWLIVLGILLIDQASKLWIKSTMYLNESIEVFSWFYIHFTENPGMAYGMEFGGVWGKLALTLFRIIAIVAIIWWLKQVVREKRKPVAIWGISLVLAGAIGNVIDSLFYGLVFSESVGHVATWFPEGGGYAPFLQGKVVDMLYFPIFSGYLPEWVPFKGGSYFTFFNAIFNVADVAISTGIGLLLLFQKTVFNKIPTAQG